MPAISGEGWCCGRRRCPIMPNGRRCAKQVVIFSRPGSPPGRPTTSRARPFAVASSVIQKTSAATLPMHSSFFASSDDVLVGGLTLANIRRGCAQAGSLGYWMGAAYARQGHMTAAVTAIIPFAFGTLEAAPDRSRVHPGQRRVGPAAGENRFQTRGLCPAISLHRWGLAGPPAVRPDQGRPVTLIPDPPWGRHGLIGIRRGEGAFCRENSSYFNASGA